MNKMYLIVELYHPNRDITFTSVKNMLILPTTTKCLNKKIKK